MDDIVSSHVCCSFVTFLDGSIEANIIGEGTEKLCRELVYMIPAIAYKSNKIVKGADIVVLTKEQWVAL